MSEESRAETLATVERLVREVMDDEAGLGPPIAMDTSFSNDLELESIEFVALAEKLQQRFGSSVDLAGWLSGMELDRILSLDVGDLVGFIESCLGRGDDASAPDGGRT